MGPQLYGYAYQVFDLTLVLDTGGAYSDGDVLSDTVELTNFFRVPGKCANVMTVSVLDEDDQGAAMDVLFLDANKSLGTANGAPNISDANARSIIGRMMVPAASFYDIGGARFASVTNNTSTGNLPLLLKGVAAATSVWVGTISRGTGTFTAAGLRLKIGVLQE